MVISTPCSPAEVIDKITVLEIKLKVIKDEGKLKNVRDEHALLMGALTEVITLTEEILVLKDQLALANQSIWDSEDAVRADWQDDAKCLAAARNSHYMNDERARIKREINKLLGSSITEEKSHPKYDPGKK